MFKLSPSERLTRWKSLRHKIGLMDLDDACKQVLLFWNSFPFVPYYLQPDSPKTWPDPWELIIENCYCDLAKCLGIIYTLYLSKHNQQLLPELRIYFDTKTRHTYHIAYFHHGKYVLNLIDNEIVNNKHINQDLKLKYCYTEADLKLEQY